MSANWLMSACCLQVASILILLAVDWKCHVILGLPNFYTQQVLVKQASLLAVVSSWKG